MNKYSNIFHDISILNIRKIDETYPCKEIKYRDLSNSYSFLKFNNAYSEITERNVIEHPTSLEKEIFGQPVDLLQKLNTKEVSGNLHLDADAIFRKGISRDYKKDMAPILKLKERVYEQLMREYEEVRHGEKGEITILPISFYCQSRTAQLGDIVNAVKIMNKAFNLAISKLSQRAMWRRVITCKRVTMLDENFNPFIHVLFYIRDGAVSERFVAEIMAVWASKIPAEYEIRIALYSFNFEFLCSLWRYFSSEEGIEVSGKAYPHELVLRKTIFFGDVLMPFPNVRLRDYDKHEPFRELSRLMNRERKTDARERYQRIPKAEPRKEYSKLKESVINHKAYFLRIAKKANKINFTRIIG